MFMAKRCILSTWCKKYLHCITGFETFFFLFLFFLKNSEIFKRLFLLNIILICPLISFSENIQAPRCPALWRVCKSYVLQQKYQTVSEHIDNNIWSFGKLQILHVTKIVFNFHSNVIWLLETDSHNSIKSSLALLCRKIRHWKKAFQKLQQLCQFHCKWSIL